MGTVEIEQHFVKECLAYNDIRWWLYKNTAEQGLQLFIRGRSSEESSGFDYQTSEKERQVNQNFTIN